MEHCRIAGTHLRGRDPHVRREVRLHEHVLVVDGAACRQLERLRHLDDDVGLDVPAGGERERRRGVGFVARRRAAIGPRVQRRDLAIDQASLVGEVADARIGEPWRHLPARDRGLDGARPRPGLLVGEERHRRDFAWPMAALTVGLENRKHVLVEGRRFCRRNGCSEQGTDDSNQARSHTRSLLRVDREMPKQYTAKDRLNSVNSS